MTDQTERPDPSGAAFATPEEVVAATHLPPDEKRAILERWRNRAGNAEPDTGDLDLATRIARALAFLDTETGAHEVTHDQGFYTSVSDVKK